MILLLAAVSGCSSQLGVKVADLYEEIDEHTEALTPAA